MYYTVESHTTHGVELKVGEPYEVHTRVLAVDDKRLRLFHALHRTRDGALVATGEQMHLHVGVKAGKTVPVADAIRVQLERILNAQAKEPLPPQVGRAIGQALKG